MNKFIKPIITSILMSLTIITSSVVIIGCGNNQSSKESVVKFNEEQAKIESKAQIEKLLNLHEDDEVICTYADVDKLKNLINNELRDYITDDYYDNLQNKLKSKSISNDDMLFFISYTGKKNIYWTGKYSINMPKVDKDNEILTYQINSTAASSHSAIYFDMKKDDGTWKIDKISSYEKYNS